jgi:hypothetical protein
MGIRNTTITLMDIGVKAIEKKFNEICICELGNQHTKDLPDCKTGKQYLTGLGAEHVSFDINGKNGAIKVDLARKIPERWINNFDMVTNYGTG